MSIAPDMLFHMGGVPVGGARFSSPWATHWFVDGTDGNDNNDGKTPGTAKATIQAAVTASTGGDVIYIRPQVYTLGTGFARYTEDITVAQAQTAGSGTEANANKSIIGVTQRQYPSDMLGVGRSMQLRLTVDGTSNVPVRILRVLGILRKMPLPIPCSLRATVLPERRALMDARCIM